MKCNGINPSTGEHIEIEFDSVISHVDPVLTPAHRDVYVAPGFIDLQVNGCAGVDYNSSSTPVEEIS